MRQRVFFKMFGCRTNIYDVAIILKSLKNYVVTGDIERADIVIISSCVVTNRADSKIRSYINLLEKKQGKKIILSGCAIENSAKELFDKKKIFGFFGHSEKKNIAKLLDLGVPFFQRGNLEFIDETLVDDFYGKTKAYIKIQEGCDFKCSYCIIPSVRGSSRSQDEGKILKQVELLVSKGYSEFVLTGTNIGSYGRDKNTTLARLLKSISLIKGVRRIRLSSLEPTQIDDEFREILPERWLERHLHIALQHTSNKMLRIMNRRGSISNALKLFDYLSSMGFALGTDFIVGHPKESCDIWEDAKDMFKRFNITHLHAFVYSKREGTPSASMRDSIAKSIAKERLRYLKEVAKSNNFAFRSFNKNIRLDVLVERKKDEFFVGYDQFYNKLLIKTDKELSNRWISIDRYEVKPSNNFISI